MAAKQKSAFDLVDRMSQARETIAQLKRAAQDFQSEVAQSREGVAAVRSLADADAICRWAEKYIAAVESKIIKDSLDGKPFFMAPEDAFGIFGFEAIAAEVEGETEL
jgi:hypothetical protein